MVLLWSLIFENFLISNPMMKIIVGGWNSNPARSRNARSHRSKNFSRSGSRPATTPPLRIKDAAGEVPKLMQIRKREAKRGSGDQASTKTRRVCGVTILPASHQIEITKPFWTEESAGYVWRHKASRYSTVQVFERSSQRILAPSI